MENIDNRIKDEHFDKSSKISKYLLALFLIVQTGYCWMCLVRAKALPYDNNYGLIIQAIILSFVPIIVIYFIWYYNSRMTKFNRYFVIAWLFLGSPITFVTATIFYSDIFGNLAT